MKIKVQSPDGEPVLNLVTDAGKLVCRVEHDEQPEEVLHNVAKAICEVAGIEFEGLW